MKSILKGIISLTLIALYTILLCIPLYFFAIIRLIIPSKKVHLTLSKWIDWCPITWITFNMLLAKYWLHVQWDITLPEYLDPKAWYIVTSNHISWIDPFAIHAALHKKIPFLKFFAKQEVMLIPFVNFACYAAGFPILKRYSKKILEKNPSLRQKDIQTTLKACENLTRYPNGILTFSEGTRWTAEKHKSQNSPFQYLLKPKTGGLAYALLGLQSKKITFILDVTILYPSRNVTFWQYMCGDIRLIKVIVKKHEIPENLINWHYSDSEEYREAFRVWLHDLWTKKDQMLIKHYR